MPSGHLFLWTDKYHLCTGFGDWLVGTALDIVGDMVTWHKKRIGMGYRTRRASEHLIVLQKRPRKAKGVWKVHTIPDVWSETVGKRDRVHPKPVWGLQSALIEAVSNPGDVVIDPTPPPVRSRSWRRADRRADLPRMRHQRMRIPR